MKRIGITCQLSRSNWSGSIKQAAVNLYECLNSAGFEVVYLNNGKNAAPLNKKHVAYNINDITQQGFPKLDVIIMHGFTIKGEEFHWIKKTHTDCKLVLYHHGNRIAIDQHNLLTGKTFLERSSFIDEIWIPTHHSYSAQYVRAFHGGSPSVKSVPYLWSNYFLEQELKNKKLRFDPNKKAQVVILEPNKNHSKTCLIPLLICETFNRNFPKACVSFSFFNSESLKINSAAQKLISQFSLSEQEKIFLNKKWKTTDILSRIGQYVLSHQTENELNYLYFESLYLDLPLIHNSSIIKEYGYYYCRYDINTASNQIYNCILNHTDNLPYYKEQNKILLSSVDPLNLKNTDIYKSIINNLLK